MSKTYPATSMCFNDLPTPNWTFWMARFAWVLFLWQSVLRTVWLHSLLYALLYLCPESPDYDYEVGAILIKYEECCTYTAPVANIANIEWSRYYRLGIVVSYDTYPWNAFFVMIEKFLLKSTKKNRLALIFSTLPLISVTLLVNINYVFETTIWK